MANHKIGIHTQRIEGLIDGIVAKQTEALVDPFLKLLEREINKGRGSGNKVKLSKR